jgi:hypothetical protein
MAFTTSNVWIKPRSFCFLAKCLYPYFLFTKRYLPDEFWDQHHVRACISKLDPRYRAGAAQVPLPRNWRVFRTQQAAFFVRTSTVVVTVEITAFFPSRSAHIEWLDEIPKPWLHTRRFVYRCVSDHQHSQTQALELPILCSS